MIRKLQIRYHNMPVAVKAALWFVVCTLMQKCISFLTIPLFTRLMSTEEYGIYSIYLSWYSILLVVCTMNTHTVVYVNQLTNAKTVQDRNKIAIPLISLSVVTTVAAAGVMLLGSDAFGDLVGLPPGILVHIFLQILFQIPVNFWMMKQRHTYAYMPLLRFSVAMALCNALLGILFVWLSSADRAGARVASISVVQLVFGGLLYIGFIKTEKQCFSTRGWKHTLAVQLPLIPHGLASSVLYSADRIMIKSLVGATEAGIYSLAYSVGYVVSMLKQCIVDALKPWLLTNLRNREYSQIYQKTKPVFLVVAVLTTITGVFAPEIIFILAPAEYRAAVYGIPAVALSSYFGFLYSMFSLPSFYFEKTGKVMLVSVSAAVLNLVLNAVCIPRFGYMAAAYTTLVCYLFFAVTHYILMRRICRGALGDVPIYDMKFIVQLSVAMVLVSGGLPVLYRYMFIRYGLVLVLCMAIYRNRKKFLDMVAAIQKPKGA